MATAPPAIPRCRSKQFWTKLAVGFFSAYGVIVGLLLFFEDRILFHPVDADKKWHEAPAGFAVQDINLRTADGVGIHARWFPIDGAKDAVLICHSRAGNLSLELNRRELDGWQNQLGCSVLIFDYPGYGRSDGVPSEAGCYAAADAAYEWLIKQKGILPEHVILYGRSLGTAVAVDLASRNEHKALILVSPFTSIPDVAQTRFPFLPANLLMRNRFSSIAKIDRCRRPTLIAHGTDDREVPFELGVKLFESVHEPKRFVAVDGARHGDCVRPDLSSNIREIAIGSAIQKFQVPTDPR